jgi:hypothetical protein
MNGLRILFTFSAAPPMNLRVPHPWCVRVGSCALTPPIPFSSLPGLAFSWVTLLRNLELKTYNLQLSIPPEAIA